MTFRCPYSKCLYIGFKDRDKVCDHLLVYNIVKRYTFWYHHEESLDNICCFMIMLENLKINLKLPIT
ncbi:GPI inositol-deacylase [Bienertia sinuspersici]